MSKELEIFKVLPVSQNRTKAFIRELRKYSKEFGWKAPKKSNYSYLSFMVVNTKNNEMVGGFILSGFSYYEDDFHFTLGAVFVKEEYRRQHIFKNIIVQYVKSHFAEYEVVIGAYGNNLTNQLIYEKSFGKPDSYASDGSVWYVVNKGITKENEVEVDE